MTCDSLKYTLELHHLRVEFHLFSVLIRIHIYVYNLTKLNVKTYINCFKNLVRSLGLNNLEFENKQHPL